MSQTADKSSIFKSLGLDHKSKINVKDKQWQIHDFKVKQW